MPSVSNAQRKLLFATKGPSWVRAHHFDTKGHLPEHVKKKRKKRTVPRPDSRGFY